MPGIGVISNRNSRLNRLNPELKDQLAFVIGSDGDVNSTSSINDVYKAIETFRRIGIDIIATSPSVIYEITLTNGEIVIIDNPSKMPDKVKIASISEPYVNANIFVPSEYIGPIMQLCQEKRGT